METEIWKDVPNWESYYHVSNLGKVKSKIRPYIVACKKGKIKTGVRKEKLLRAGLDSSGYRQVVLNAHNKNKSFKVHKLVAIAFLGHNPCGNTIQVDHINKVRTDNRLANLAILTAREHNHKDARSGTSKHMGVSWSKERVKWVVQIFINKKHTSLGRFDCELAAAKA